MGLSWLLASVISVDRVPAYAKSYGATSRVHRIVLKKEFYLLDVSKARKVLFDGGSGGVLMSDRFQDA